jgi:hypothetical protein
MRRGTLLVIGVFAAAVWVTAPAPADTSNDGHQHLETECVVTETALGPMVSARTTWQVWSNQGSPDGYRWQARLIPTRPGLNFFRSWHEVEVDVDDDVEATGASNYYATVTTPVMSPNLDWDLQVKLTWDRADQRDGNAEHVLDFDERACATT